MISLEIGPRQLFFKQLTPSPFYLTPPAFGYPPFVCLINVEKRGGAQRAGGFLKFYTKILLHLERTEEA